MVVSSRFDSALRTLSRVFRSYLKAPRSPDSVGELADQRAELEDARTVMTAARNEEGLTGAKPRVSPKWVEPGRRVATPFERSMAFVAIGLFLTVLFGGVFLGVYAFRSAGSIDVVKLRSGSVEESLTETASGSCVWSVSFELITERSSSVDLRDVLIAVSPAGVPVGSLPRLRFSSPVSTLGQVGYEFESCPTSVDDIDHGDLIVSYTTFGSAEILTKSLGW